MRQQILKDRKQMTTESLSRSIRNGAFYDLLILAADVAQRIISTYHKGRGNPLYVF